MPLVPAHVRRAVNNGIKEIERDQIRLNRQVNTLLAKAERDPISALNLRYVPRKGIIGDRIRIEGKWVFINVGPTFAYAPSGSGVKWVPAKRQRGGTTIQPLQLVTSPWGIIIAFRVSNRDPEFRPKLNWFKKSDPASGPVYLVDPVGHQYLYLTASSLRGEVVAGIPQTGLLVFANPESPTHRLQVHFSGVRVGNASRGLSSFSLECTGATLRENLEELKSGRTVSARLLDEVHRQVAQVRHEFVKETAGPLRHFMHLT